MFTTTCKTASFLKTRRDWLSLCTSPYSRKQTQTCIHVNMLAQYVVEDCAAMDDRDATAITDAARLDDKYALPSFLDIASFFCQFFAELATKAAL